VEIWHGLHHRIGHLGEGQDDFNLLGHVYSTHPLVAVTCVVNDGAARNLRFKQFRRIVTDGDFNADISISTLKVGENRVAIQARDSEGNTASAKATITRFSQGSTPFPCRIRWSQIKDPEEVGQYTDGKWRLTPQGLRTGQIGYDRVFLIGERYWQDYEVTASVTIHGLSKLNGPQSWTVRHAGFCLHWAGHSLEENDPGEQPKWGLHPRGGIVWLTIRDGQLPPVRQFYPGDSEKWQTFKFFAIQLGRPFRMKGRCETLTDDPGGAGVTRYSFKVWNQDQPEPERWDFQVTQTSHTALRRGGLALVAHELDAEFGDLTIVGFN
jgi:hypothetical protein